VNVKGTPLKRFATVMIIALACAILVAAQNPPPAPTPGPEVKKLDYFAGNWKAEGDFKPGPMGPGGKFTETTHREWMPGAFFLVDHTTESGAMGNATLLGVFGYDTNAKVYAFDEFGSTGETVHAKGTVNGDTWTWNSDEVMGGQAMHGRFTVKITSPTAYTFKFEIQPEGGAWTTIVEGKATKTK
jgi:Protein of unknown function (DUF1579)